MQQHCCAETYASDTGITCDLFLRAQTCMQRCWQRLVARRRYDFFLASPLLGATQYETEFDYGGTHVYVSTCVVEGLRCFFIEPQNGFFAVDSVYGRKDDGMRFEFFCKARHWV